MYIISIVLPVLCEDTGKLYLSICTSTSSNKGSLRPLSLSPYLSTGACRGFQNTWGANFFRTRKFSPGKLLSQLFSLF